MRFNLTIVAFLFSGILMAQTWNGFKKLSKYERRWVYAHPFIAKKAFKITKHVEHVCDSIKKDTIFYGNGNGDQLDAFRHALWMAMLCQRIKPGKAYKLGQAHEFGNREMFGKHRFEDGELPDSMSIVMDIINNQIGIEIGIKSKIPHTKTDEKKLIEYIIAEIKKGNLRILIKDKAGNFYTCDFKPINLEDYKHKWGIPKCLVRSDFVQR